MCKKDQLLEYSIQDIIDMISTDLSIEYDEAMNKFYNSEVFEKLIDKVYQYTYNITDLNPNYKPKEDKNNDIIVAGLGE